ncbi:MAG: carboxypeptidase-like regulatory domain-containing protein [Pirellulaceae bacterium]
MPDRSIRKGYRPLVGWWAVAWVVSLIGCGGPENVGQVSGKVTMDGQPLADAVVQFEPLAGNAPSSGITDASGEYTLRYTREHLGAEVGEHRVRITTFRGGDPDADPPRPPVKEKVPAKYNGQTELRADVKSGANTFDFELQSGGKIEQPKND